MFRPLRARVRNKRFAGLRAACRGVASAALLAASIAAGSASADPAPEAAQPRQALDDAWWTGSLVSLSAATLPTGHYLLEPYFFDVHPYGHFDAGGERRHVTREDGLSSLTIMEYGVTDTFTLGAIPRFEDRRISTGGSASGLGVGDLTLQGQYRLAQYHEGGFSPGVSLLVTETLPLGKYDRLGGRPGDGVGGGAYSTGLGLLAQDYFWTPAGRILRTRLNMTYTVSNRARLRDVSVYGTPEGFRGSAKPGDAFNVDVAFEYSVTRNWVLALDVGYERDASTRVEGLVPPQTATGPATIHFQRSSGVGESLILAPAIEYNWTPNLGVIFGAKMLPAGRNAPALFIPALAINYVH